MKKFLNFFYDQVPVSVATLLLVTFSPIVIIIYYLQKKRDLKHISSRTGTLPEASGACPVIGHLLLFNKEKELTHVTLGNMADIYGPIFCLRFGSHKTIVVSSWEMVKECFTGNNDKLFSNRPCSLAIKHMFYGTESYGFSPYGKYWRELRKISTHKLLSNQQLEKFKNLRVSEVDNSFKKLHELCSSSSSKNYIDNNKHGDSTASATSLVRMDDWFAYLTFNVIGRIVTGVQSNAVTGATTTQEKYKLAMDEASHLMATFAISDVVPWLGWIDRLTGLTGKMKNCGKKFDAVVGSAVEDHRKKKQIFGDTTGALMDHEQEDFIDICLSIMEQSQIPGNNPEITVKSIVLDMLLGGTDTTKLIMTWTLSLLLNHPDVLDKATEEVDTHFRKNSDAADVTNLVYIQAIIKESMRLYPCTALLERMTSDDCEVGGFHIPAGTRLWVNVWKMQRDPRVWKDPLVFRPERFLSNDKAVVDVKGQHYELIPFGIGRRICPGVSFTLEVLHLALSRLIFEFEMKAPPGGIDMRATPGLFNFKVMPLDVMITPRTLE